MTIKPNIVIIIADDLKNDPQELYNRIDDPDLSEVRNHLRERLLQWYLSTSDNPLWEYERDI
jgi:hypothetical protein